MCPRCSTKALITRPNVRRLLFISPASRARPYTEEKNLEIEKKDAPTQLKSERLLTSLAPERDIFSDPAKSTKFSFPHLINSSPSGVASLICIVIEKRECDRLKIKNCRYVRETITTSNC